MCRRCGTRREGGGSVKQQSDFLDVFLRGSGPSLQLLGAFALGLLVVGLLSNLLYDLLVSPAETIGAIWLPVTAVLILTGLSYLLYWLDRRRESSIQAVFDESRLAPPHSGLIWLFGPGPVEHLLFALKHHQRDDGPGHCWLVMQDTRTIREAFSKLTQQIAEQGLRTQLHPVYINQLDAGAAYRAARTIFDREAAEEGLTRGAVIGDITGGTKPLTAGLLLAALTTGNQLEYVESERDDEGRPIPNTLRVVLVDTEFYLAEKPSLPDRWRPGSIALAPRAESSN